jgi:hypothetical protein
MPDPRKCCILGVCCPPGGKAQRADLKAWLLDKLGLEPLNNAAVPPAAAVSHSAPVSRADVESWLDELFGESEAATNAKTEKEGAVVEPVKEPAAFGATVPGALEPLPVDDHGTTSAEREANATFDEETKDPLAG